MNKHDQSRRNGTFGRFAFSGCGVIIVVVALWCMAALTTPAIHIPTPVMPNPNAFDTYLRASSQMVNPKLVDNAWYSPERAKRDGIKIPSLPNRERLIAQNAPALVTLRIGLAQPYWNTPLRSIKTM